MKTIQPLLSVLVITYNHENYIRQCLEGIVMQKTTFPIEVIVGEDCSTDNTRAVVREFEERYPDMIKPVYHTKNVGGGKNAYEFCYPLIKGAYVAFCEGDDYWTDPYKLQKQVDFLEQHPEFVLSFHKANVVNHADQITVQKTPSKTIKTYSPSDIFHIHIPTLSAVFRHCIPKMPDDLLTVKGADAFVFGLLARFGGAADLGFVGAHYRKHAGGTFSTKNAVRQYRHALETRQIMRESAAFTDEQKKEIDRELRRRKKMYAKICLKKRDVYNCVRFLLA
ncbi:glycosyltransferase family 2 protein [Flavisolibacter nicotianae]|uniref:glycosyltransferase family 2 protein n=1 Tax=Flavisolibacter nicotianae TaxID=2364882 RepID=UPI000EB582AD|nr:glycosyltransferase [Flavisolibacter nicotianae]